MDNSAHKNNLMRRVVGALPPLLPMFPVLVCAKWFAMNRRYPLTDNDALMLFPGLNAYHAWKAEGILKALSEIYWYREFKPIFHPALALFPLMMTGGNVRASVAIVNLCLFSLFVFYLYKLLRLFLPRWHSSVSVCVLGVLPWVIRAVVTYSTELPFLAAATAATYYLLRSEYFHSRAYSLRLGIAAAFAFCFHPGVTAIGLGAALFVHSVAALKRGMIERRDFIFGGVVLLDHLGLAAAMALSGGTQSTLSSIAYCQAAFLLVFLGTWVWLAARGKAGVSYFLFVSLTVVVANAWYLPFLHKLYYWVKQGLNTPLLGEAWTFRTGMYTDVFSQFGRYFLVAAYGLILWRAARILFNRLKDVRLSESMAVFLSLILVPPLIGSFTHNKDVRYYFFYFTMAYAFASILLYHQDAGGVFLKILKNIFPLAGVLSSAVVLSMIFQWNISWLEKTSKWMGYSSYDAKDWGIVPNPSAEPGLSVAREVCRAVSSAPTGLVGISASWQLIPEELGLICKEHDQNVVFTDLAVSEGESIDAMLDRARTLTPFLIVGPCNRSDFYNGDGHPHVRARFDTKQELCRQWHAGTLPSIGFEAIKKIGAYDPGLDFILLKSMNWKKEDVGPCEIGPC